MVQEGHVLCSAVFNALTEDLDEKKEKKKKGAVEGGVGDRSNSEQVTENAEKNVFTKNNETKKNRKNRVTKTDEQGMKFGR